MTDATLTELNRRIAAIRENIRELIEQAAAYSGAADDERTAAPRETSVKFRSAGSVWEVSPGQIGI